MRLDKKKEEELARRKGSANKTLIQTVWLLISLAIAYVLTMYLFNQGTITADLLYRQGIPRSIPEWGLQLGVAILLTICMQIFLLLGFVFANPEGRRKLGEPTLVSRNKDAFDDR